MPLQLNPTNLAGLVDLPVGMRPQQEEFLANASRNDSLALQQQGLANLFQQQADPLRLRQLELGNQTTEAGLPGIMANGQIAQRKNKIESMFEDKQIQDMMGKYKSEELSRHVKDMEGVGQLALQGAEQVWSNPIAGRAMVKQKLEKAGVWNPKWDSLPPDRLAMELSNFGQGIQATGAKFTQAMELQSMKSATAENVARIAADTRMRVEQLKGQLAQEKVAATATKDPKTLEQGIAVNMARAQAATDPDIKQAFLEAAMEYQAQYQAAIKLKATAPQGSKLNVPEMIDQPAVPVQNMPPIGGAKPKLGTSENPIKLD